MSLDEAEVEVDSRAEDTREVDLARGEDRIGRRERVAREAIPADAFSDLRSYPRVRKEILDESVD